VNRGPQEVTESGIGAAFFFHLLTCSTDLLLYFFALGRKNSTA
jgi:hypothetical protein